MQFADGFVTAAAAQPSMVVLFRAVNGEPFTFGLNQSAQQSTRSERRDRCLVNAHFNLNEPRTAVRKHKVGDWKGQARGTVPMRPAADVEAPEASAQPFQILRVQSFPRAPKNHPSDATMMKTYCQSTAHAGAACVLKRSAFCFGVPMMVNSTYWHVQEER